MIPNKKQSQLRVIAGQWRGCKITFPNLKTVRPTTDRIRETVFNWLYPYIDNTHCLDAFAGSGILGFEALSRYAASVTFVDQAKINMQSIIANAQKLKIGDRIKTYNQDFFSTNIQIDPFDIVFLDPPYHQQLINKALTYLKKKAWINKNTIIYIEGEKNIIAQLPESFEILKEKTTKKICFALIKVKQAYG